MKAHAAVAAELLGNEALVAAVIENAQESGLSPAEKALFTFVDKVNRESPTIAPEDIRAVEAAGWSDEAIYDAITVCALFNFYNRWIDASGVHALSDEMHRASAKRMAADGYIRTLE